MGCSRKSLALLLSSMIISLAILPSIALAESSWNTQLVDSHGSYGKLAIDSNNNPHILYDSFTIVDDSVDYRLGYAYWTGKNWSTQILPVSPSGIGSTISLDQHNKPYLIFKTNSGLDYAFFDGTNWILQALPSVTSERLGGYTLATDQSGNQHIAYSNYSYASNIYTTNLWYTTMNGSNWTINSIETRQSNTSTGYSPISISLDSKNNPYILYEQGNDYFYYSTFLKREQIFPTYDVKLAVWKDSDWALQTVFHNESNTNIGALGNLVLDSKGQPHLCYVHANTTYFPNYGTFMVRYSLEYTYFDGSTWINQTIQSKPDNIEYQQPFLRLDSENNPQVYFYMQNYQNVSDSGLKVAKLSGSNWQITTIGSSDYTSIAFDSHGSPHFVSDSYSGTIRGATILGNLTYSSLVQSPSNSTIGITAVVFAALVISLVAGLVLTLFRRHRKTPKA